MGKQTILGSGGAIGNELAKILPEYSNDIRLVSRHPVPVNKEDELFTADLLNAEETVAAVQGSEVVYLTAGLPYKLKTWQEQWPVVISNVIDACKKANSRLVFFDNIYMYDPSCLDNITEEAPVNPQAKKGIIRAEIAARVLDAHKKGLIQAVIARSADFYGPGFDATSILSQTVINPLKQGKKANWLGGLHHQHSFTYTPDAARATAMLGNTPESFGQVWHLPTSPFPLTGQQWVELIANELNVKPRVQVAPGIIVRLLGLFNPIMKELVEMMYQYDRDYIFNSDKFEKAFNIRPTPYTEGIKKVLQTAE